MQTMRLRQTEPGVWAAHRPQDMRACKEWPLGTVVEFEPKRSRSSQSERFWFACIDRAHENLPDHLQRRFPDAEALRAYVLIRAGWCEYTETALGSEETAIAYAAGLLWGSPYSIVEQRGNIVVAYRAKSQRRRDMNRKQFSEYTDRGLTILAELLGIDPVTLLKQSEAA